MPPPRPAPCKLTFDLLTLKLVSESRVTWSTSVPVLVFLGLSVLDLGPMYASERQADRQTSDARHRLLLPTLRAWYNNPKIVLCNASQSSSLPSHHSYKHAW